MIALDGVWVFHNFFLLLLGVWLLELDLKLSWLSSRVKSLLVEVSLLGEVPELQLWRFLVGVLRSFFGLSQTQRWKLLDLKDWRSNIAGVLVQ